MNRREVIRAGALLSMPLWIRDAFAGTSAQDGVRLVSSAFRRAQRAGRPLLVLVIPQESERPPPADVGDGLRDLLGDLGVRVPDAGWARGRAFGAFIMHASDAQLAPLGLVEVIAARQRDLRAVVPAAGQDEALMVLVETDRVPARVRRDEGPLSEWVRGEGPGREREARERWASTEKDEARRMVAWVAERVAALVRPGKLSPDRVRALARDAAALRRDRLPGSYWGRSTGCGSRVEGRPDMSPGYLCGMGHVSPLSGRFLHFYVDS